MNAELNANTHARFMLATTTKCSWFQWKITEIAAHSSSERKWDERAEYS